MNKMKVVCKNCNTVHKILEQGEIITNMPALCKSCNMERMAIEPILKQDEKPMEYDIWISNKRTGASRHEGWIASSEDVMRKSDAEVEDLFVERTVKTLVKLLSNKQFVHELLE